MKTKNRNILLLPIIFAVLFSSCGEEFVTKEFENGVVSDNFFKNASDAEQALTAVYDIVAARGMYGESMWVIGDATSDDINEQTGDSGDYGAFYRAASDYRWEASNPYSERRWFDGYKGIFRANILLQELPDIEMDNALKSRFEGEAKFLRALYYYNLIMAFGDVPFMTTLLTREDFLELARTDKQIIYAQIEQDLIDAAAVLPIDAGDPVGRVTKGAANGLLSRVYLFQDKWTEAANAAKLVMDGTYQLLPTEDFAKMFNGQLENSNESLFEFQAVSFAPGIWGTDTENSFGFLWSPLIGWANWYSPSVGSQEQFENGDIRRKASLLIVGQNDSIDTDGDGIVEFFPSGNMNGNYFNNANVRKWLPEGRNMASGNEYEVNFPILRYAEILLNYAEAQNELGNSAEALPALNEIRVRAMVPSYTETNQALLRQLIRDERRRELLFEGQRFHDLQRWGIAEEVLGPLGYRAGTHEYWPVPLVELDLMPNLTQYP